jgi:hypothetical protein
MIFAGRAPYGSQGAGVTLFQLKGGSFSSPFSNF